MVSDYLETNVKTKLDLFGGTTGIYAGFDRFGRTIDHRWVNYQSSPVDAARLRYGYDYASNRTWREDVVAVANSKNRDEFYTYDGLHRLDDFERGDLSGTYPSYTSITSKNYAQQWGLDQLGNWATFKQDADGNGTWELNQTRAHNAANELGVLSPWEDATHDAAGNMRNIPFPQIQGGAMWAKYDAWNRMVALNFQTDVVAIYVYDGLGRRVEYVDDDSNSIGYGTYIYTYNEQWQAVARVWDSEDITDNFVWHPYYIDALAVRYRSDGVSSEKHYFLQDANFNVVAAADDAGSVVERYDYTPYGTVRFLEPDFDVAASQLDSIIKNVHFYTGRERDPGIGIQINRNRYYSSWLGRWTKRDPIGYEGSPYNLYEYVRGGAVTDIDPSGMICVKCTCQKGYWWKETKETYNRNCDLNSPGGGIRRMIDCCQGAVCGLAWKATAAERCDNIPNQPCTFWDVWTNCSQQKCNVACGLKGVACGVACYTKFNKHPHALAACEAACAAFSVGCFAGCVRCKHP